MVFSRPFLGCGCGLADCGLRIEKGVWNVVMGITGVVVVVVVVGGEVR